MLPPRVRDVRALPACATQGWVGEGLLHNLELRPMLPRLLRSEQPTKGPGRALGINPAEAARARHCRGEEQNKGGASKSTLNPKSRRRCLTACKHACHAITTQSVPRLRNWSISTPLDT